MYKYETHLHTYPVSRCARAGVEETLQFYKEMGYDGVFLTNHFLDGNINIAPQVPYAEKIEFFFSDYEKAAEIGKELGLKVFCGAEIDDGGIEFLVYGLDKAWYLAHPEIMKMKKSEELPFLMAEGALVIQAHPFREANYIDHLELYPRQVHGVEVVNACRTAEENAMAALYATHYGLLHFAGTDNHTARRKKLAGMCSQEPILDEQDFVNKVKNGQMEIFTMETP
jgi:hypothetical protein